MDMKDKIGKIVIVVVIAEIILLFVGIIMTFLQSFDLQSGCVYRYDPNGASSSSDSIFYNVMINANGQYSSDKSLYGQWVKLDTIVPKNTSLSVKIQGNVSLCTSKLPTYNLYSNSNTNDKNEVISIPRVEDNQSNPLVLSFPATMQGWRNLIEVYSGDAIDVSIVDMPTQAKNGASLSNMSYYNSFLSSQINADCTSSKRTYDPICGRWSMWNGTQSYMSYCTANYGENAICGSRCCDEDAFGTCWSWVTGSEGCYDSCDYGTVNSSILPAPYDENESRNITANSNIPDVVAKRCDSRSVTQDPCSCSSVETTCLTGCNSSYSACISNYNSCNNTYNTCIADCDANSCSTQNSCNICKNNCLSNLTCLPTNRGITTLHDFQASCSSTKTSCTNQCGTAKTNCQGTCSSNTASCDTSNSLVQQCIYAQNIGGLNTSISGYKYWFSANNAGGLYQRFYDAASTPTALDTSTSGATFAAIQTAEQDQFRGDYYGRKLYSGYQNFDGNLAQYLQYAYYDSDNSSSHTGGYLIQVKHTKCRRISGEAKTDPGYANRGQIKYIISYDNPNNNPNYIQNGAGNNLNGFDNNFSTTIETGENTGYLWVRIDNKNEDYKDSSGNYNLSVAYSSGGGGFTDTVLTPLFTIIKSRLNIAGMQVFQNLICYNKNVNSSCTNLFNYIKAILTLYVIIYGFMFLTGTVKISAEDLLIRVTKIGLVAGLISGETFLWFNQTIYPMIIGFTDQMIANFAGFDNISVLNRAAPGVLEYGANVPAPLTSAGAPFMFLDAVFGKIFFSTTFWIQIAAIIGIGMIGLLYFIIVCVGFVIVIIAGMRAIAVYIIAMIGTAFLLTLAPIFLTFMLFEQTFYLFQNWYKALFRYMLEPVIVMIGVIILVQIFTLYLDNVLSYSACWKCAILFTFPLADLLPIPGLENIPLFCINWYAPWGYDTYSGSENLGMNLGAILGFVIIAFALYGYCELASGMAMRITQGGGQGSSSIKGGLAMSSSIGQAALRQVGLDKKTRMKNKQDEQKYKQQAKSKRQEGFKDRETKLESRTKAYKENEQRFKKDVADGKIIPPKEFYDKQKQDASNRPGSNSAQFSNISQNGNDRERSSNRDILNDGVKDVLNQETKNRVVNQTRSTLDTIRSLSTEERQKLGSDNSYEDRKQVADDVASRVSGDVDRVKIASALLSLDSQDLADTSSLANEDQRNAALERLNRKTLQSEVDDAIHNFAVQQTEILGSVNARSIELAIWYNPDTDQFLDSMKNDHLDGLTPSNVRDTTQFSDIARNLSDRELQSISMDNPDRDGAIDAISNRFPDPIDVQRVSDALHNLRGNELGFLARDNGNREDFIQSLDNTDITSLRNRSGPPSSNDV